MGALHINEIRINAIGKTSGLEFLPVRLSMQRLAGTTHYTGVWLPPFADTIMSLCAMLEAYRGNVSLLYPVFENAYAFIEQTTSFRWLFTE